MNSTRKEDEPDAVTNDASLRPLRLRDLRVSLGPELPLNRHTHRVALSSLSVLKRDKEKRRETQRRGERRNRKEWPI